MSLFDSLHSTESQMNIETCSNWYLGDTTPLTFVDFKKHTKLSNCIAVHVLTKGRRGGGGGINFL